jgi:hypothetical protein
MSDARESDPERYGIFSRLQADHLRLRARLESIEACALAIVFERDGLFAELEQELLALAEAVDQVLYPTIELYPSTSGLVRVARERARVIAHVLAELSDDDVRDDEPRWLARYQVLAELVERHFDADEDELYDLAADLLGRARAFALADELEDARADARARLAVRGLVRTQRDDRMLREERPATSALPN